MKSKEAIEKEKRFMLIRPLLFFPFLTLLFWSLGGGKGNAEDVSGEIIGFNSDLPDARLDEKELDKLALYEKAVKDSAKRQEEARNDPYFRQNGDFEDDDEFNYSFRSFDRFNPKEQEIYEKLDRLNNVLEESNRQETYTPERTYPSREQQNLREDVERLEQMMKMMESSTTGPDREMEQINSVLETVLDIQHPERVQEKLRQSSSENRGLVYAVSGINEEDPVSLLENKTVRQYAESYNANPEKRENRFLGLDNSKLTWDEHNSQSILAVVHEDQTVVSGSTIKLRLLQDIFINGQKIAKDNFVHGTANLNGERLEISINDIRSEAYLLSVQLAVHDLDGLPGIKVPGAISRDAAKQSGDRAIQGMNIGTFNPSLGAQAASAGIELGRNLLSRKIKLIKVDLKAGYKVLLKDNKRKEY